MVRASCSSISMACFGSNERIATACIAELDRLLATTGTQLVLKCNARPQPRLIRAVIVGYFMGLTTTDTSLAQGVLP